MGRTISQCSNAVLQNSFAQKQKKVRLIMSKNTYYRICELIDQAEEGGEDFSEERHDLEIIFESQF
jgi:hypothetical protein